MKKMLMIGGIVLVVVIAIAVALFVFVFNKSDEPAPVVYLEYQLGVQYTNIKDDKKILKFNIAIEYTAEEIAAEFEKNNSKIINNVIQIFRTKNFDDLMKTNSQERVREEIKDMIIETIESDAETITDVYFLEYIIQG
ncbi:MAG: flagellar basal body-associated FliL family protein [Acidaminobacteraceae bacterium]